MGEVGLGLLIAGLQSCGGFQFRDRLSWLIELEISGPQIGSRNGRTGPQVRSVLQQRQRSRKVASFGVDEAESFVDIEVGGVASEQILKQGLRLLRVLLIVVGKCLTEFRGVRGCHRFGCSGACLAEGSGRRRQDGYQQDCSK
jgi:hypothetical protein